MTHCTSHGTEMLTKQDHCAFTSRDSLKQVDVGHTEPLMVTPAKGDVKNPGIPHSPKAEQSGGPTSSRETPVQEDVCGTDQFQVSSGREGAMNHCNSHRYEAPAEQSGAASSSRETLVQEDVCGTDQFQVSSGREGVTNHCNSHRYEAPTEQIRIASSSRETPVQEDICGTDQFQVTSGREGAMNHCNSHRYEAPAEQNGAASSSRETLVQEDVCGTDQFQVSSGIAGAMNHCNSHRYEAPAEQNGAASSSRETPVQEDVCGTDQFQVSSGIAGAMNHCNSHRYEAPAEQNGAASSSRETLVQEDVCGTDQFQVSSGIAGAMNHCNSHRYEAPAEQNGAASSSRETPVQEDVCGTDQFQVSSGREGVMNHCNSHRYEAPAEQSGPASHSRETPVQEDICGTDQFQVSSGREGATNHCNSHRYEAPAERSGPASHSRATPVQEDVCGTERLLVAHLARSGFSQPAPRPWTIARSGISGRGLVATRDLQAGDLVLVDGPLVLAPRASPRSPPLCAACHRGGVPLQACAAGCGLPLCARCGCSAGHRSECSALLAWRGGSVAGSWSPCLLWVLGAVRCLGLGAADREVLRCLLAHGGPSHAVELEILEKELNGGPGPTKPEQDFMRLSCRVMDANAFETPQPPEEDEAGPPSPSLRGLYPAAAMMNHACSPNTMHVCGKGHRMVVRAAVAVRAGEELTNSYTTLLWGTLVRRRHLLATKHFLCRCERCRHPQEWGARLSALACPRPLCGGCVMPCDPLQLSPAWRCDACDAQLSGRQAGAVQAALGRLLEHVDTSSPGDIRRFLAGQAGALPACNQVAVQLKCDLICQYGHREGHLYNELSDSHLQHKEILCKEILHLLEILRTGQCNMKGLICYELACTLLEQRKRLSQGDGGAAETRRCETVGLEARAALEQSALIFQGDATAPAGLWRLLDEASTSTSTADLHLASPGL